MICTKGAGGGAGGLGRLDRADSGKHRLEGGGQGAVEGEGASSSAKGFTWAKDMERDKVYDRG